MTRLGETFQKINHQHVLRRMGISTEEHRTMREEAWVDENVGYTMREFKEGGEAALYCIEKNRCHEKNYIPSELLNEYDEDKFDEAIDKACFGNNELDDLLEEAVRDNLKKAAPYEVE